MKRGDILFPHSFTLAAAVSRLGNNVAVRDIATFLDGRGPDRRSYHQILKHMRKHGHLDRVTDEGLDTKERVQWSLTESGKSILDDSADYYRFALHVFGE